MTIKTVCVTHLKLLLSSCGLGLVLILAGCDGGSKTSAQLGTVPKKIVDKATNDINKAAADTADKLKSLDEATGTDKKN
jgi:hypothetical protein